MKPPHQPNEDDALNAPERLRQALAALDRPSLTVPPAVDAAVLGLAREHLQRLPRPQAPSAADCKSAIRQSATLRYGRGSGRLFVPREVLEPGWWWRRLAPWGAVALALLTAAWLAVRLLEPGRGRPVADLNGDGQVDIVDALLLAREVDRGTRPGRPLDLNGDGVIDRRDADWIAMRAVALEKNRRL